MSLSLTAIENIIDTSGTAPVIEGLLPPAVRGRQLTARTLLTGMMLALADGRPAHLTRVLEALAGLPAFLRAAGISCCQRLGDITAGLDPGSEEDAVALLGALAAGGARR